MMIISTAKLDWRCWKGGEADDDQGTDEPERREWLVITNEAAFEVH